MTEQSGATAGITQEQLNLVTAYMWHLWSALTQTIKRILEHREDEESFEEDPSDTAQLQQMLGVPKSPPKSQVLGMPPPPHSILARMKCHFFDTLKKYAPTPIKALSPFIKAYHPNQHV